MPIALTDSGRVLAEAVAAWAARARPVEAVRAAETDPTAWRRTWPDLAEFLSCALPEDLGGGGGTVTDLAVVLAAAAEAMAPGPILPTALAGLVLAEAGGPADVVRGLASGSLTAAVGLRAVVPGTTRPVLGTGVHLLVTDSACYLAEAKSLDLTAGDLAAVVGEARVDEAPEPLDVDPQRVRDLAVTLAAAEAAGIAAWCLRTAVDYAKVREQFGARIGSFQAVKHLCAQLLCRAEVAAAVAADAAAAADDADQHPVSAAVAAALALDAAVDNAKDCIQVLGGIGFTWEHDAHLYLRRAVALRSWLGGSSRWRQRVAELTVAGRRRALRLEHGLDRTSVRDTVAEIAAAPDRRRALADSGYLVPHWPAPYGLVASPELQLLIDEELAAAEVTRPDLVIAGWAIPTVLEHGTPEQIERFVRPTLYGELTWCQLFSEPEAGSDLASLRTRAERVEGGWRLTGQKVWSSLAHRADWGVCLARSNADVPKHKGISYFLVDMRSPGIDVRPLRDITGEPAFNEVFLDGVFVPDDLVVGDVDGGWPLARTTLTHERVAMGGGSSIGDAVERLIAAHRDTSDPVVLDRLGGLVADGLAGSLLDLRSIRRRLERTSDDGATASVRKLIGVAHRQDVAEAALDLLGPDALIASEELQQFLLTRCLSIAGGTSQILMNVAAERILGLPR